jgi:hypothetical protein
MYDLEGIRDYTLAALIYQAEKDNQTKLKLNLDIVEENELVNQLCTLKFLLKRVEFNCENKDDLIKTVINNYSVYAIYYTVVYYVRHRKEILNGVYKCYQGEQKAWEAKVVYRMIEVTKDNIGYLCGEIEKSYERTNKAVSFMWRVCGGTQEDRRVYTGRKYL